MSETLTLQPDGGFQQTVVYGAGDPHKLNDSWTKDNQQICFKRLYVTFSLETGKIISPPETVQMAYMVYAKGALVFNADIEGRQYVFRKLPKAKSE